MPLIAGIESSIGSTSMLSCPFALETAMFSGSPSAVTSRWSLLPALPRSVGLGPVSSPLFSITYNISGPFTFTETSDGGFAIDAQGDNLFFTTEQNSFEGIPQLV